MESNNILNKRTKAEWKLCQDPGSDRITIFEDNNIISGKIAVVNHNGHLDKDEAEANAAFICKAVNEYDKLKEQNNSLLEALKKVNNWLDSDNDYEGAIYDVVKDAIKKAEQ